MFVRLRCTKFNRLFLCISLILFVCVYLQRTCVVHRTESLIFHSHDFRFYPESRSALEYERIQIKNHVDSMFKFNKNQTNSTKFRLASYPILWLDRHGDVRWNRAAQSEFLNYLLDKQYPTNDISICLSTQLFILQQWTLGGFFSRHHTFIDHFGQTFYSPSMVVPTFTRFVVSQSDTEDFRNEGTFRYFQSTSLCSAHIQHVKLRKLYDFLQNFDVNSTDVKLIQTIDQLVERDESKVRFKYSRDIWKFSSYDIPHRRWLFDRNREKIKHQLTYSSSIDLFVDHSNEHIYSYDNNLTVLYDWTPRNMPHQLPTEFLNKSNTEVTLRDFIFASFVRYMCLLFFSPLAPRIQTAVKLLAHHWSEYLSDKNNQPYTEVLSKMAVLFIRRGDKMNEDSFWKSHQYWRNISLYVKGIVDEEKRRQMKYTSIFVITDDATVMSSIQEYARVGLTDKHKDESYAREYLFERQILYNVFAPQACFDPFIRIGFDQFLVNIQFITDYAALVVGHRDSNVGRYIEEIIYVNRQHERNAQTRTYVINAPDSFV